MTVGPFTLPFNASCSAMGIVPLIRLRTALETLVSSVTLGTNVPVL